MLAEIFGPQTVARSTLCRPCAGGGKPCAGHLVPQCSRTISVKCTNTDSTWEVSTNRDKSTKTAPMKTKRPSQTQILRERRQQTVTNQQEDEGGWAHPIMGPVGTPSPPTPPQTSPPPQNNIPAKATKIMHWGARQGKQNQ